MINHSTWPYNLDVCGCCLTDTEMQRLAALRPKLPSAASIILPKAHPSSVCHGNTRADPAPIRLHASQFDLNEMITVAGIAKETMQSKRGASLSALWPASILQDEIKKTIIVVIGPCRCSVG